MDEFESSFSLPIASITVDLRRQDINRRIIDEVEARTGEQKKGYRQEDGIRAGANEPLNTNETGAPTTALVGGEYALSGAISRRSLSSHAGSHGSAPMYKGQGVYFAYLYVGTPSQRVSVIIDTGSHHTAFPCVGCSCGKHLDPPFDPSRSSTSKTHTCNGKNRCIFKQAYSEGSSWSAYKIEDEAYMGTQSTLKSPAEISAYKKLSIPFQFGCQESETGLFRTQHIDGIMGISAHESTLPFQLFERNLTTTRAFSLCIAESSGMLAFGGVPTNLLPTNFKTDGIQFIRLLKNRGWFTVKLLDVFLKDNSKENNSPLDSDTRLNRLVVDMSEANRGKGVIVDSGTTDTYLPKSWSRQFVALFEKISKEKYNNARQVMLTDEQLDRLPSIVYRFEAIDTGKGGKGGGAYKTDAKGVAYVEVECTARAYAEKVVKGNAFPNNNNNNNNNKNNNNINNNPNNNPNQASPYIFRIYVNEPAGAVLGGNFMLHHNVFLDVDKMRMAMYKSSCTDTIASVGSSSSTSSSNSLSSLSLSSLTSLLAPSASNELKNPKNPTTSASSSPILSDPRFVPGTLLSNSNFNSNSNLSPVSASSSSIFSSLSLSSSSSQPVSQPLSSAIDTPSLLGTNYSNPFHHQNQAVAFLVHNHQQILIVVIIAALIALVRCLCCSKKGKVVEDDDDDYEDDDNEDAEGGGGVKNLYASAKARKDRRELSSTSSSRAKTPSTSELNSNFKNSGAHTSMSRNSSKSGSGGGASTSTAKSAFGHEDREYERVKPTTSSTSSISTPNQSNLSSKNGGIHSYLVRNRARGGS